MKKTLLLLLMIAAVVANAQDWQSCTNWTQKDYSLGRIRNNIWNSGATGAGSQCMWSNSLADWGCDAVHTNGVGAVKGYPQCLRGWTQGGAWTVSSGLPVRLPQLNNADIYWRMETPSAGRYMALWDIYLHDGSDPGAGKPKTSLMIFQYTYENQTYLIDEAKKGTSITIDGKSYNYQIKSEWWATGNTIVLYMTPINTHSTGMMDASINLKSVIDYFVGLGYIASDEYLISVQNGWEIIEGGIFKTTGYYANINTVVVPATGISVAPTTNTITINGSVQLSTAFTPTNASNKNVLWSSSDTTIAKVNGNGLVNGIANGNCIITVKTIDGNYTATSNITVKSVLLSATNDTICSAGSANLLVSGGIGPYQWYDQATGGIHVNTGNSFNPDISSNTTFYINDSGITDLTIGKTTQGVGTIWTMGNTNFNEADKATKITVTKAIVLKSVCLYVGSAGTNVKINLKNGTTNLLSATQNNLATGKQTIVLNWIIQPGTYTIDLSGSDGNFQFEAANANFPYSLNGYLKFENSASWGSTWYGYFYDWKLNYLRTPVFAIIDPLNKKCINTITEESNNTNLKITIYPNPIIDNLYIANATDYEKAIIYDLNGRALMQSFNLGVNINVSNLPSGYYIIKIISDGKTTIRNFIKH